MDGRPVDVISVCSANGEILPLRLRMEDEQRQILRINVETVVDKKEIPYVGAEATVYLCRATLCGRPWLFELQYDIRSHSWSICGTDGNFQKNKTSPGK